MTSKLKTKSTSSRVGGVSSPSPSPSSFDKIDELLTLSPEKISVIDYERELMKRRAHLLRCLKDPSIYQEFMRFMSNSKSTRFLFILNVLFMIFFIPTCTKLAAPSSTHGNIWFICEFLVEVSLTVTGWLLYGCLADESWLRPYSEWVREQTKMKTWDQLGDVLQSIFYISAVLVRALDLIQRVESGPCKDSSYLSSFSYDYHPASPTKLCYRIEDEVITSEPDNYQSPVTTMLRQLSMAHISRKSTSSRLSMKSGQVSVMGSQWFREATSTNSRGLDVMLNSMSYKTYSKDCELSTRHEPARKPVRQRLFSRDRGIHTTAQTTQSSTSYPSQEDVHSFECISGVSSFSGEFSSGVREELP
eukprot:gene3022-3210_t